MSALFKAFVDDETGAIAFDWVILTGAIVWLIIAVMAADAPLTF